MPTDPTSGLVDQYGEILRHPGGRGGTTGGGGGAIGPGGGFGGAFGGSGFFGAERGAPTGDFFGVNTMRLKRKLLDGPSGPISISSSPMFQDSVPAMMMPGEGVLNVGAMSQPGMTDFLNAANQQGVKKMAAGGMVESGDAEDSGGMDERKKMILKLIELLLGDGGDGGDGPQHFAWGGFVKPQTGGFSQPGGQQAQPSVLFGGGGRMGGPRPMGFPQGGGSAPGPQPMQQPSPQATPLGSPNPTNPWSSDPFAQGSTNPGDDFMQRMMALLRQYGNAGMFDPNGSPALMQALQGKATQTADALRQRANTNAGLLGLDPGQAASYKMQTDLGTQGQVGRTLNDAVLQQQLAQQQFAQGLLNSAYGANQQAWLAQLAKWMGG